MSRKKIIHQNLINAHFQNTREKKLVESKSEPKIFEESVNQHKQLSPELKELLNTPIDKTSLSVRVKNICWNAGINKISDLANYSRSSFSKLRNSGKKTGDETELFLKSRGLSWKMQSSKQNDMKKNEKNALNYKLYSKYV